MSWTFKFHYNPTKITGTLHEDVFTFMTTPRWFLLRVRSVSDKSFGENQNIHFTFSDWLFSEYRAVYEIMSKNMVEPERTQTIRRLRVAYWISKLTRRKHTPALVHLYPLIHPPTHTHTHTHTHTQKHVILLSRATVVSRTLLSVTLPVHYLSCLSQI